MAQQDIGLVGLAVMGQNLVLNMERNGFGVAVFNRTGEKTATFVEDKCAGKNIVPTYSMEELVGALATPRRVMLMVKAGEAVDGMIDQLRPHLQAGDIVIDGGNSFFQDTIRRGASLAEDGILYIGTGVSGGEEGALWGPSIMPGGQPAAYEAVEPILKAIAAKVDDVPCCAYIGPDGAGHYVKMVHNGIEYGDMQLICEAYFLMKHLLGMEAPELHEVFTTWNQGDLNSYLIEITADIFAKIDPDTGQPLVELIVDKAGQKGTGKWTSQSALDLGVPAATVAEAVFARCLSAVKDERVAASAKLRGPKREYRGDRKKLIDQIHDALYASKVCSYAQGFALMKEAAKEYGWTLDFGEIARIWRGGCIIRAQFLHRITEAFDSRRPPANLLLAPYFRKVVHKTQRNLRRVVSMAVRHGVPVPAFSSALAYYDGYRCARLPANLIQAQRDYFGAHTYLRVDKEGTFHTEWQTGK